MTEAMQSRPAGMGDPATSGTNPCLRHLITPEGVDLRLHLATGGERMGALFVDLFIMALGLIIMTLAAVLFLPAVGMSRGGEVIAVIWLLGFFFLRVVYFPYFELGPRAATPGKRMLGIRVAPRRGGRLTATAVLARNATREIELFLPISFLLMSGFSGQETVDAWIIVSGGVWTLIFALFPYCNRDRLRPGDIIAGTWVIEAPRRQLEADMAAQGERTLGAFGFTTEQLDAYGVRELHVLEDILRAGDTATLKGAADRIRAKIRRPMPDGESDSEFLSAYYTALRQRLEKRLLYGVRRRDKNDRR